MPKSTIRKQTFKFNTFSNGLSKSPADWKTHGAYAAGVDILGIGNIDGSDTFSRVNVVQAARQLTPLPVSSTTPLSAMLDWLTIYSGVVANEVWGFDTTTPKLFRSETGSVGIFTLVSAHTPSTTTGGGGMAVFVSALSDALYYGQNSTLGRVTSGLNYNDSVGTFATGGATPRPMKIFGGVLNIGNDNYISTIDATGSFTQKALTLPSGYVVKSLEVLPDYLFISADNGYVSRIFTWTGGTATFQEAYDLPEGKAPLLVQKEGSIYAVGQKIYQLGITNYQVLLPTKFYYDGGEIAPTLGSISRWLEHFVFGRSRSSGQLASGNVDQGSGIWLYGRASNQLLTGAPYSQFPYSLHMPFLVPPYTSYSTSVGGICVNREELYVAYQNVSASNWGVASTLTNDSSIPFINSSANAYYVTLPMDFDTGSKKIFHSLKCTVIGASSFSVFNVYYRIDTDFDAGTSIGAWTLLANGLSSTDILNFPIRQTGRNIQFKFVWAGITGNQPQLIDYSVVYEILDIYR